MRIAITNDGSHGIWREIATGIPSGYTNDGIFYHVDGGITYERVITSTMRAEGCGIFANGSDMTARINAAFAHSKINAIIFDAKGGGDIVISGAVSIPTTKTVKVEKGTRLTGSGSITGGIWEASSETQIFDTTLALTNLQSGLPYFSVKWFGAKTDGTDAHPAIQRAVDMIIYTTVNVRTIYFPSGNYYISAPIVCAYMAASKYQFFTINLKGDGGAYFTGSGATANILPTFTDRPAIIFQNARSSIISGLAIMGRFNPVFLGGNKEFYETLSTAYVAKSAVSCRDNAKSPYAGIHIDPFTNDGTRLGADEYPGMGSYYAYATLGTHHSGSSAVRVEDCGISGFVVNHIIGGNGLSRNGDNMTVERVTSQVCKVAFASCNDQQKDNFYRNIVCWDRVHTVFDNVDYGSGTPGQFHVDGANLAGNINRLWNIRSGGYYGSFFKNIFAESIFQLGMIAGDVPSSVENMNIDFAFPGAYTDMPSPDTFGRLRSVKFTNCTIRRYGPYDYIGLYCTGDVVFDNCNFGSLNNAYILTDFGQPSDRKASFINPTPAVAQFASNTTRPIPIGKSVWSHPFGDGGVLEIEYNNVKPVWYKYLGNVAATKNTSTHKLSFTASQGFSLAQVGQHVGIYIFGAINHMDYVHASLQGTQAFNGWIIAGRIESVNTSTGAIVLNSVPLNLPAGTYGFYIVRQVAYGAPFIGDTTPGSNVITNVEAFTSFPAVGQMVYNADWVDEYGEITAADAGAKTVTVEYNLLRNQTGKNFFNGRPTLSYVGSYNSVNTGRLYFKGARIRNSWSDETFEVIQSGFLTPSGGEVHTLLYDGNIGNSKYKGTDGNGNPGWFTLPSSGGGPAITQYSIQGDGTLGSEIQLVNDSTSPGNSKYYGTDGTGVKGYFSFPSGGGTLEATLDAGAQLAQSHTIDLNTYGLAFANGDVILDSTAKLRFDTNLGNNSYMRGVGGQTPFEWWVSGNKMMTLGGSTLFVAVRNGLDLYDTNANNESEIKIRQNSTATVMSLAPLQNDGASAVAYTFDTRAAFTTAGAKIVSFKTGGTEKFFVDKDGSVESSGYMKSAAPSGSTAGRWKLGIKNTIGSGTVSPDTVGYVTVEIEGVLYNLALVTIP